MFARLFSLEGCQTVLNNLDSWIPEVGEKPRHHAGEFQRLVF